MLPVPVFETPGPNITWDSFVPDLVVGIFTGLVVGLVLAWTQSRAARKRERREIELRWEALRSRVGAQLLDPWDRRFMGSTLEEFAARTDALRELVQDAPLGSWAEILGSDELRNLHEFAKVSAQLRGVAHRFDWFLRHQIAKQLVDPRAAKTSDWQRAHEQAVLVQPFVMRALFADPSRPRSAFESADVRSGSPVVERVVRNPPVMYDEVLSMVERAENHYVACTAIVDAPMTRYYYD